jgi:hypothetical protein
LPMIAEHPSRNLQAIPQWRPKGTTESFFRAGTARAIEPRISLSPPPHRLSVRIPTLSISAEPTLHSYRPIESRCVEFVHPA